MRAALVVAVAGSATAGLVHIAAVRGHDGQQVLVWMFALCAIAQLGWAALVVRRPSRSVLVGGLVLNGGALLFWAASRTVGIPFIDALAGAEAVGEQDLGAALFAAASVAGTACLLLRPTARAAITPVWTGALAVFALLAALPALTAGHSHDDHDDHAHVETAAHEHEGDDAADHDDDAHGHDEATDADDHAHAASGTTHDEEHAHDEATADLVGHDDHDATGTTGHQHDTTDTTGHQHDTTDTTDGHDHDTPGTTVPHDHPDPDDPPAPTGPIISLDDPRVTPAQRAIAQRLLSEARTALSAYPNVAAIEAAGYVSIGDGGDFGFEHYVKWPYLYDGRELDPTRIESIVVKKNGTGPKQIVSAMYILNLGKTMANVPALAGELTTFHLHDDLCFEGTTLVAIAVGGVCSRGVLMITPPMLHVWMIPRPCGPFAGLEGDDEACLGHEH